MSNCECVLTDAGSPSSGDGISGQNDKCFESTASQKSGLHGDLISAQALYKRLSTHNPPLPHVQLSLRTLDAAFRLYKPANVCVAFNGGKDATVVLYLALASFARYVALQSKDANASHDSNGLTLESSSRLNCLYLTGTSDDNFPEVNDFVEQTVASVPLLHTIRVEMGIRDGIENFVSSRNSQCAFMMGTRRTDPHGKNMERFEPSSPDWPPFMRVNPILHWRYADVWTFLRTFEIPFCSLYRHGYTSLGSVSNTSPNPALRLGVDDVVSYRPAWLLEDEELERAGRRST